MASGGKQAAVEPASAAALNEVHRGVARRLRFLWWAHRARSVSYQLPKLAIVAGALLVGAWTALQVITILSQMGNVLTIRTI